MEKPTCQTCPHWVEFADEPDEDFEGGNIGECQRFPAQVVYDLFLHGSRLLRNWVQPEMSWWQGCGEHPDFPAYQRARAAEMRARAAEDAPPAQPL